jgi:hypothetical protein
MGNLHCRIELNKDSSKGIFIFVDDNGKKQSIRLKSGEITIESTDGSKISTITQTPKEVKITTSSFDVEADEITFHSKRTTKITADSDMSFNSKGKTDIDAMRSLDIKASQNASLSAGMNLTAKGNVNTTLEGKITTVKGNMTNIEGTVVKLG